jgi:hypothetical protein
MKTLVKMIAGSHLYGSNTENSDMDYKGVYLPDITDCILQRVGKTLNESTGKNGTKNTKDDVDCEIYSIQHFIKLATAGETVAIDMLHTPDNFILEQSDAWRFIRDKKTMFHTKNMKAFIGYARSQAKRYSAKGERLKLAEDCLAVIKNKHDGARLGDSFFMLKNIKGTDFTKDSFGLTFVDINGRKLSDKVSIRYAKNVIQDIIDDYGRRARKALNMGGADWKAVSHALRVVLEIKEILETGGLVFPLTKAPLILSVKNGTMDFTQVMDMIDNLIIEVDELTAKSGLPEKVNVKFWEDFIVNLYKE